MRRDIDTVEVIHPELGSKRVPPSSVAALRRRGWEPSGDPATIASIQPATANTTAATEQPPKQPRPAKPRSRDRSTATAATETVPAGDDTPTTPQEG